ncbi:unnamed protein product [Boreogadus saida]
MRPNSQQVARERPLRKRPLGKRHLGWGHLGRRPLGKTHLRKNWREKCYSGRPPMEEDHKAAPREPTLNNWQMTLGATPKTSPP